MKSAHRHELETNALAHRLEVYIEQWRPYASTIFGAIIALAVLMFIWTYWSGASAAKHSGSWDTFNQAIGAAQPDLDQLRRTAEEFPGTQMQQMADVTWADGQVRLASMNYIYSRSAANDGLTRATSVYQGLLQSSDDKRILNRARLGMARIYEMQNELEKAREQYLLVGGGYAEYAKQQAQRLAEPDSKETYAWLATAKPPLPRMPMGPGTPGQTPPFSAGDLPISGATDNSPGTTEENKSPDASFQDILNSLQKKPDDGTDRYPTDNPAEGEKDFGAAPANPPAEAPQPEAPPADGATPPAPAAEQPATETPSK